MKGLSLRTRILAWFVGLTGLLLAGFSAALYLQTRAALLDRVDESLRVRAESLANRFETDHGRPAVEPEDGVGAERPHEDSFAGAAVYTCADGKLAGSEGAWKPDQEILKPWLDAPPDGGSPPSSMAAPLVRTLRSPDGRALRVFMALFRIEEKRERIGYGEEEEDEEEGAGGWFRTAPRGPTTILVAVAADLEDAREALAGLAVLLGTAGPAVLLAAVVCGWFLARRITGPLASIASAAEAIRASDLARKVPVTGAGDEIDRLAETLNGTFGRLRDAFERERRFTADASHELRTPMAVVKSQAEVALAKPREPEVYREALLDIQTAAARAEEILESLLFLARADNRRLGAGFEELDPAELAREAIVRFEKAAREKTVLLGVDAALPLTLSGDRVLLSLLLRNLLSNAVRHCRTGGKVTVRIAREGGDPVLSVADEGEGIPAEALPRLFERFFRVDEARARRAGGAGLGLAIVKAIAEAHGAAVSASSEVGAGTTVRVRFPASPGSREGSPDS